MNDTELDKRLEEFRAVTDGTRFENTLHDLGTRAAIAAQRDDAVVPSKAARARRTSWAWGLGMAAAAVVLTAGAAATSIYLEIPPFVSLVPGDIRTTESIPLRYETTNGIEIRCRIFMDFAHVSSAQVDAVDAAITAHDWSRFGQDLYDAQQPLPPAPPLSESLSPQDKVEAAVEPAVRTFAASLIPGLVFSPGAHPGEPVLSSTEETCVPSAQ